MPVFLIELDDIDELSSALGLKASVIESAMSELPLSIASDHFLSFAKRAF